MPRVGLYVNRADKELLDGLPDGVTGAALLRLGIGLYRRQSEECAHPHAMVVCPSCGHREQLVRVDEDPGDTSGDADLVDEDLDEAKGQVSRV